MRWSDILTDDSGQRVVVEASVSGMGASNLLSMPRCKPWVEPYVHSMIVRSSSSPIIAI